MGDHVDKGEITAEHKRQFTKHLLNDIAALELMLEKDMFEKGIQRIGAEQELVFVGPDWKPDLNAYKLLDKVKDKHFTTEIGKFNLEINLDPFEFTGDCFTKMERQLNKLMSKIITKARQADSKAVLTGILPSFTKDLLSFNNMTPNPRYELLSDTIKAQRGGDFEIFITGIDELITRHDNILFEACNTSFQVHLQVDAPDFVDFYNWSQAIAGPVLSVCANSPLLFGKRLWSESRIALFQQSVDTRNPNVVKREVEPRVGFGRDWLYDSPAEIFKDIISRYNLFFTKDIAEDSVEMVKRGEVPELDALKLHNGTVYKWNRACYGISNGQPHLRIENRYIPSGPTVIDEMANTAFWLGLMRGFPEKYRNINSKMKFEDARFNFYKACRTCIDTQFKWFDKYISSKDLLEQELLPIARQGLESVNVNKRDIDRLLGVIEERVAKNTNGSKWMVRNFGELMNNSTAYEASVNITKSLYQNQMFGAPVHTWEDIDQATIDSQKEFNTVRNIMITDFPTVNDQDLLDLVISIMDWRKQRYIPVENDKNELVGLITTSRLVHHYKFYQNAADFKVADIMIDKLITVSPNSSTAEAVKLMSEKGIGCLPVISSDNRLIGLVTERSIVLVANMSGRFN